MRAPDPTFPSLMKAGRDFIVDLRSDSVVPGDWNPALGRSELLLTQARAATLLRLRAGLMTKLEDVDVLACVPPVSSFSDDDPTGEAALLYVRLTLHNVPLIPEPLISWHPRSPIGYSDILAPQGPLETLRALEELARTVDTLSRWQRVPQGALRRLYAFFEAGFLWSTREVLAVRGR